MNINITGQQRLQNQTIQNQNKQQHKFNINITNNINLAIPNERRVTSTKFDICCYKNINITNNINLNLNKFKPKSVLWTIAHKQQKQKN
jgi:hypothetical protein